MGTTSEFPGAGWSRRAFLRRTAGLAVVAGLGAACAPSSPAPSGAAPAASTTRSAPTSSAAQPTSGTGQAATLRFGETGANAAEWGYYAAIEKGFFAKNGLKIDMHSANGAATVYQQLLAGAVDIGSSGLPQGILAVQSGAPIKLIAATTMVPPYRLAIGKDYHGWQDLKGKTISLGGPTDVTLYFWKVMVEKQGMQLTDFHYVWAGTAEDRYAALKSKSVAATLLLQPYDFRAEADGYQLLANLNDVLAPTDFIFAGVWVKTSALTDNEAHVVSFLKSQIQATSWLYDSANAAEAKTILNKYVPSTQDILDKTYDMLVKPGKFFSHDGVVSATTMDHVIQALVDIKALPAPVPQDKFVDTQVVQKAA